MIFTPFICVCELPATSVHICRSDSLEKTSKLHSLLNFDGSYLSVEQVTAQNKFEHIKGFHFTHIWIPGWSILGQNHFLMIKKDAWICLSFLCCMKSKRLSGQFCCLLGWPAKLSRGRGENKISHSNNVKIVFHVGKKKVGHSNIRNTTFWVWIL